MANEKGPKYTGEERRVTPCREHAETLEEFKQIIYGNGKPGLKADMEKVLLALYGHEENGIRGMVHKQQDIIAFIQPLKPFLNPKLLATLFFLSFAACVKVLGAGVVPEILKHIIK